MEVTKRLIEKYHLDLCSTAERKAVEEWLMNDILDAEIDTESAHFTLENKREIWSNISEIFPQKQKELSTHHIFNYLLSPSFIGVAATAIGLVTCLFLWNSDSQKKLPNNNFVKIESNKIIQTESLNITLGQKSKANVSASNPTQNKTIEFCGAILIHPKQDVILTLNGTCAPPLDTSETIHFKKGQTYIAVNYHFKNKNELIIVDERNISNLPPILHKEISKQFNI
ncbi:hypothetical protein [uncultured Cytophaga sp.]|uniref:hypothetical protein n=1 Tax=uncultured Cytophaga sp. TaxID=160238 RepID=UPI00262B3FE4|nr:hypothetical protein [uncultured Cytophaga sp.]